MVTIIHLSDLHFVRDAASFHMRKILLDEVEEAVRDRSLGEKLLIITGDFHNYWTEGYEDAIDFLNRLIDKMDIDRTRDVFVVPGNHDAGNDHDMAICFPKKDWKTQQELSRTKLKEDWNNPDLKKIDLETLKQRTEAYLPYCNFIKELKIYPADADIYIPAMVHVRNWRGKLNILHLNTTLVYDPKSRKDQLTDVTAACNLKTWEAYETKKTPALAIGHNHFYDLDKDQQNSLEGCFKDYNVSAYLCGDTHRITIDANNQIIPLDGRIKTNRLIIPNIVCAKGMTDLSDAYSDFGYYIHNWDEKTGKVTLLFHRWKKEYISGTVLEGDDQNYSMRGVSKADIDPYTELKEYLKGVLESDREGHPSFQFMNAEDDSGEKTEIPEIDVKCHIDGETNSITVSSAIQESWGKPENHSIVITGDGGSGKTVSLFNAAVGLQARRGIPIIYIPLYRLANGEKQCLTISNYLKERFTAKWNEIELLSEKRWDHGPSLMLLLDGFNEIPGEKRRIVLGQINEWSKTHPGTQLIAVSRPMDGLNLGEELANFPVLLELEKLDEETIRTYLKTVGRQAPKKNSLIWSELAYPHFLMLYIKTNALYGKKNVGYPLRPRTMKSGGALIWNFLQRELLRQDNEGWVLRCAIACEYILPFIAYQMTNRYSFIVSLDQVLVWINEAIDELRGLSGKWPVHLRQLANVYKRLHSSQFNMDKLSGVNWGDMVLQETGLLISKQQNKIVGPETEEDINEYSFVHQHFRDCLTALYLVNRAEMVGKDLPDVWKRPQDYNTLDYISELMELDTFQSIWETNRNTQPTSHTATITLLEILSRKKQKELLEEVPTLDFSGMNLEDMQLVKYLDKEKALNLFGKPELTIDTKVNIQTFLPIGHESVTALQTISNGLFVSGSSDRTLQIWDATTGTCLQVLKGHEKEITCFAQLQDGYIVSGSRDCTIRIWNPVTGACLKELKKSKNPFGEITGLATLEDGRIVSGTRDCTIRIWNPVTGDCLCEYEPNEMGRTCLTILKNGYIVTKSGWANNILRIWDARTGECLQDFDSNTEINYIGLLPDGRVVSECPYGGIWIRDFSTGESLRAHEGDTFFKGKITCLSVLEDGRIVSGLQDGTIKIWDSTTGECLQVLEDHERNEGDITCLTTLQDGSIVSSFRDGKLKIWDPVMGECLQTLRRNNFGIVCLTGSNDGHIISWSMDRTIRIWDTAIGKCTQVIRTPHINRITGLTMLPDGRVASVSKDCAIRIWNSNTVDCWKVPKGRTNQIVCLTLLDDKRIVSGSWDHTLRIWDSIEGGFLNIIPTDINTIGFLNCLTVLPDGRVVSGSSDGTLRIWDLSKGECLHEKSEHENGITSLAVLPDGHIVSGSMDKTMRVWDSSTYDCLQVLRTDKAILALGVLDNNRIVSGSWDGLLRIWDLKTGNYKPITSGHENDNACLAITRDKNIVNGSQEGTIQIWDSTTGICIKKIHLLDTDIDWSKMDFSRAVISQETKDTLHYNGAIVE